MKWIHRLAYSLGHILNDLCAGVWFTYTLIFLQEGILLPAFHAGVIMLIGQVADAVATPLIGIMCDRCQSTARTSSANRNGVSRQRFRFFWQEGRLRWHLGGCFLVLISFSFIFSPVYGGDHSDSWAKLIYYTPFVIIFQIGWACMQISHLALINDLTDDPNERVLLASMRHFFTVFSNLAVYCITFLLLAKTSSDSSYLRSDSRHLLLHLSRYLQYTVLFLRPDSRHADRIKEPANATDIDSSINFGPNDVYVFRTLTFIVLLVGAFFTILFYLGIRGPSTDVVFDESRRNAIRDDLEILDSPSPNPQDDELDVLIPITTSSPLAITKPLDWFGNPAFLILCLIYMLVRLIINISQVYITLYLLSSLLLPKSSIALVPLTIYLASAITTLVQKPFHDHIGRELACFIGLLFVVVFSGLALFPGSPPQLARVYIASSILGVGCTILLISSLAMVGDLIENGQSTGAFVYGVMSFTDKLANGIVVQIIQTLQPCLSVGCGNKSFYQSIETYGIAGFVFATAFLVAIYRIWNSYVRRRNLNRFSNSSHPIGYGTLSE